MLFEVISIPHLNLSVLLLVLRILVIPSNNNRHNNTYRLHHKMFGLKVEITNVPQTNPNYAECGFKLFSGQLLLFPPSTNAYKWFRNHFPLTTTIY